MTPPRRPLAGGVALLLAGCTVGPDYHTPSVPMTDMYKEISPAVYRTAGQWATAQPSDRLPRGKWWEMFGNPEIDSLEDQVTAANQTLKVSEANFREARAQIGIQRAAQFPTLTIGGNASSIQYSSNQPYFLIPNPQPQGLLQLPVDLWYEIDVWGQIRRQVAAAREQAQASAGYLATTALSLHAELAIDYVELRAADAQQKLLNDTVVAYTRALQLTESRLAGGEAPLSDVAQAKTQLDTTRVQATDIGVMRAQYEHAIAVLIGEPPAAFGLPPRPLDLLPPPIPVGVPSQLLQRRPDIATAERQMAAANEQIGIAQAAYYPSFNFNAQSGFEGNSFASWFGWPSLFWAVGLSVTEPIFEGGLRRAESELAVAGYDSAVANYRQTTLTAFQQVEDNLAALRILADEAQQEHDAVVAAEESLRIFTNRYLGGEDAYLEVINAQTFLLANQRNDVDIRRRREEAAILLVKALGGGWDVAELPRLAGSGEPAGGKD